MTTYQSFEFKYCPQCKTQLKPGDVVNSLYCPSDDKTYYFNPAACVNIYIIKNGQVLLAKRAADPYRGAWDSVGGFVDAGESLEEAALREAKEETGLDVKLGRYLGSCKDYYGRKDNPLVCVGFQATMVDESAEPKPADDVAELHWVKIDSFPKDLPFESTRYFLRKLLNK